MSRTNALITDDNLALAHDFIEQHFAGRSWWPREQPQEALAEYRLIKHHPVALMRWCEKWLDAGQRSQLARAMQK